VKIPLS